MSKLYVTANMPAHEQLNVQAKLPEPPRREGTHTMLAVSPCAVPGISLTDYSKNASQKGWGAHCVGPFTTVVLSSGVKVTVDSRIAELTKLIMNTAIARGYNYRRADTGAYVCRYISGTTVWSNHAWGLAIDCNWQTNPQRRPLTNDQPAWLLQLWNRYGFAWGGDYTGGTVPDAMHHEFMGTPVQAVAATALARAELGGVAPVPETVDLFDDVLQVGDRGLAVKKLQATLNAWYKADLVVDGQFGPATERLVKRVQAGAGLTQDGQAGPVTLGVLGLPLPTTYPAVHGAIRDHFYDDALNLEAALGDPITGELACPDGVGRYNHFERGSIYWTPATGAQAVYGAIWAKWVAVGWENSPLGYPITDELTCPDGVGRYNHFERGSIYWTPATGPQAVYGAIWAKWVAAGWENSPLGYPITDELACPDGVGRYNHFERGSIYWTPATGAQAVYGAIWAKWVAAGWENSPLGYPITDELACPDGVGRYNHFERGSIYWTPATGAHPVLGAIRQAWANAGWERTWGYPVEDQQVAVDGVRQRFGNAVAFAPAGSVDPGQVTTGTDAPAPAPAPDPTPVPATSGIPAKKTSPKTGKDEIPGVDFSYTKPDPQKLAAAGYTFAVGYVSPTPGKNLSSAQYQAYRKAGLAVGLVWESTAGRALDGADAGVADGAEADRQADALGYPINAPLFFAVDQDTSLTNYPAIQAYAAAFNARTKRPVGIYGEADVVDHFVTPGEQPVQYGWQTAAWSGGRVSAKAHLYQRVGHPAWPVPDGVGGGDFDEDVLLLPVPLAGF